ncbi:MAG: hypothetical protein HZB23_11775 [Deltaproteobacteria bacterium]|nr:hypothetical protein [Deltaproteobacteria bacterium]
MELESKYNHYKYILAVIYATIELGLFFIIYKCFDIIGVHIDAKILFIALIPCAYFIYRYRAKTFYIIASSIFIVLILISCTIFISFNKATENTSKPKIFINSEAIKIIKDEFKLKNNVINAYFYTDGFQDHTIFIAFSADKSDLEKLISKITGKQINELETWNKQIQKFDFIYGPGQIDKAYRTPLYNLDTVKDGLFFKKDDGEVHWHLVYDRKNSRLYYCWWNT